MKCYRTGCRNKPAMVDYRVDQTKCTEDVSVTYNFHGKMNNDGTHTSFCVHKKEIYWCKKHWGSWSLEDNLPFYETMQSYSKESNVAQIRPQKG